MKRLYLFLCLLPLAASLTFATAAQDGVLLESGHIVKAENMKSSAQEPRREGTPGQPATDLRGTFLGPGVTCPQFRLDSGEQISLSGDTSAMRPERRYILSGRWAMASKCMQGNELRVHGIEELD